MYLFLSAIRRFLSARWIEQTMRSLARGDPVWGDDPRRLTETVLSMARLGHAIFLDPAADLILPGDVGLRVRIIAPIEICIENYADHAAIADHWQRIESPAAQEGQGIFQRSVLPNALCLVSHDLLHS